MLRARIRLQLSNTTDEARVTSQEMLDRAFATCGEGGDEKLAEAIGILEEALALASAGVTENLGTTAEAETDEVEETPVAAEEEADDKPWWRFW